MAMASSSLYLFVVLIVMVIKMKIVYGDIYKVGDTAGWTTIGNIDYKQWAKTKTFRLGDIIVFEYNPEFHNVMQVTHAQFRSCNASSPIATHTTGNDSITITTRRHHFFLCGVPGHCQAGQKLDINVRQHHSRSHSPAVPPAAVPTVSPNLANFITPTCPIFGSLVLRFSILFYFFS
ncbi:mavicyanin-like [Andrographis paniculata]|uniref:mavicyanin-like n=1 Tax=Andrographis paniculata TaxID=175694 RepID=UPI0021E7C9DF|nr:mavicyanin-like [Andrographis paniculata]